jgi:hypothetical protein
MKKAFIGERFFNGISQMPVLKKARKRDTIVVLLFSFIRLARKLDRLPLAPRIPYGPGMTGRTGMVSPGTC